MTSSLARVLAQNEPYVAEGGGGPNLAGRAPTPSYQTRLGDLDEMAFRQWLNANAVPFNPDATEPQDYDMRGFYRGLQSGDPKARAAIDPNDAQMHYPDFWKTPLHQTFSNESQWATPDAPAWNDQDQLVSRGGRILFDDRKQASPLARLLMGQPE